ncbi:hypothetical protein LV457_05405 [Mycobacterium sp. MYCO198283]|uniref:hypothetical protein n=1 Tax=Mycobacterium sp. MYCO198283 TaxID=2883505 RepID=UPI001E2AE21E|nr:hypothetical protein [Mycobacterium sp. MYCO198283]MCG5431728.1 hypothetical protein [Mycobacterium sp. MYCO198283]
MSYAEFQALVKARSPVLDELTEQFDALLDGMQTSAARSAMAAAFDADPQRLGEAAVEAHR